MRRKTIGDQELALLQYIGENEPTSVGEVAARFGEARGLARSTVLTMMERLRTKGYLQREQDEGVYRYSSTAEQQDVVNGAVGSFVEKTLQGSISPFVVVDVGEGRGQRQRTGRTGSAGQQAAVAAPGGLSHVDDA